MIRMIFRKLALLLHLDGWLEHGDVAIAILESDALGGNGYFVLWLYPMEHGFPANNEWIELCKF